MEMGMAEQDSIRLYEQQVQIGGMTCASCVARVEKALKKIDGVVEASVSLSTEKAYIRRQQPIAAAVLVQEIESTRSDAPSQQFAENIAGMPCASCVGRAE